MRYFRIGIPRGTRLDTETWRRSVTVEFCHSAPAYAARTATDEFRISVTVYRCDGSNAGVDRDTVRTIRSANRAIREANYVIVRDATVVFLHSARTEEPLAGLYRVSGAEE